MTATAAPDSGGNPAGLLALAGGLTKRSQRALFAWYAGAQSFRVGLRMYQRARNQLAYTLTVQGSDAIYDELHAWLLDSLPPVRRRAMTVRSGATGHDSGAPIALGDDRPATTKLRFLYDGSREQTVTIGGHRVKVAVERREQQVVSERLAREWAMPEKVTLTAYTIEGRDAVIAHLEALAHKVLSNDTRPPRFYMATQWGDWERRDEMALRPLDTVVLPEGVLEGVIADINKFRGQEGDYRDLGMPWHRGYLFHGPPGTGKTSLAKAIASQFHMDVYYVPLGDLREDTSLFRLIAQVQPGAMLLLEDIDVLAAAQERGKESEKFGVSLSGLLNALDGTSTPHGLVTVMSTNRREVLDAALIRPGRVDYEVSLPFVDAEQARRLIERFTRRRYVGALPNQWTQSDAAKLVGVTSAMLLETIKRHIGDPAGAHKAIDAMIRKANK